MKKFLRKRWSDILLGIFLLLMLIPQTRKPVQIFINRITALSPSIKSEEDQKELKTYSLLMEDMNGNQRNLNEAHGEVILINFWATWCPPCIAEMPDFQELYADYGDKVRFYFITQDKKVLIDNFENKRNYGLPYYRMMNTNPELDYRQLPTTYLISRSGKIVLEKTGVAKWNSDSFRKKLDELIKEK